MASVADSAETLMALWLPPKPTNPILAPTTSAFGKLDEDALLLIARHLVPQPNATDWFVAARQALRDLNALVRSCRFWRDAFDGVCQLVRLEGIAIASSCVLPALPCCNRAGDGVGACFQQLLAQAVHAVHIVMLRRAASLMVTHCTLAHCSDAVRALRSYTSDAFHIDERTDVANLPDKIRLTRYALRGKCVRMHVAISSVWLYGIVASQGARGGAPGGALLVAGEHVSDAERTHRRLSRARPLECDPVFTYVESSQARVFSPNSELKKSAPFRPGAWVSCAAVCGDVAMLCEGEPVGSERADRTWHSGVHAISLWSVTEPNCPRLSLSAQTSGVALRIWAFDGTSRDKGDYLEVYTLVHHEYVNLCDTLDVRVVRYARATREWSATAALALHLDSACSRGLAWNYAEFAYIGRDHPGISLCRSVQPATESPVTSAALTVAGIIEFYDNTSDLVAQTISRSRALVVDRIPSEPYEPVCPHSEMLVQADWPIDDNPPYFPVSGNDPDVHLSHCGTVLVVLYPTDGDFGAILDVCRRDPVLGWRRHRRHAKVDTLTNGVVRCAPPIGNHWMNGRLRHWARAHLITSCQVTEKHQQSGTSAFSPCGKYLALLVNSLVYVIDVHESLWLDQLNLHAIPIKPNTEPYAIAWPDGLFVETSHGVWHIGTYDVAAAS